MTARLRDTLLLLLVTAVASAVALVLVSDRLQAQIAAGSVRIRSSTDQSITLGQKTMANSLPFAFASDQSALPASQSGSWTVQPGNTANTTAWLVTGTGGTFPATQSGTWTVQPGNTANTTAWLFLHGGFTSLVAGQQAVTATAAALPTNTARRVCVKVLAAGTQTVYFGPSTVTTANGQELSPGDAWCGPVDNSNRIYVIAGATGSTVAFDVLN